MGVRNGPVFNLGPRIKSDASRAATYSKRKKGLLKKVKELSILCGVDAAVMCHHPDLDGASGSPLLWGHPTLDTVLTRFKSVAAEEREKRKLDNTSFLRNQVQKLATDLHHVADHNQQLAAHFEHSLWDDRLNNLTAKELKQVASQVLQRKKDIAVLLATECQIQNFTSTSSNPNYNDGTHKVQLAGPVQGLEELVAPYLQGIETTANLQLVSGTESQNSIVSSCDEELEVVKKKIPEAQSMAGEDSAEAEGDAALFQPDDEFGAFASVDMAADVFDLWPDGSGDGCAYGDGDGYGYGFGFGGFAGAAVPPATLFCQPNQALQTEAPFLVPELMN